MNRTIAILLGLVLSTGSGLAFAGKGGGGGGGGRGGGGHSFSGGTAARPAASGGFTRFTTGPMRFTTGPQAGWRPIARPPIAGHPVRSEERV